MTKIPFFFQPEVQAKAKQEIAQHLKTHGKLTYDNLSELKYLAMVCQGGWKRSSNVFLKAPLLILLIYSYRDLPYVPRLLLP